MIARPVDEVDNFLDSLSFRIICKMRKMATEFNISASIEAIPDYFLLWPKKRDKAIDSLRVTWCRNRDDFSSWYPCPLCFSE